MKVMSSNGTVLMLMDNVVFRKVLPEQIQMAIAAQSTPEDATQPQSSWNLARRARKECPLPSLLLSPVPKPEDQKIYEIEWQAATEVEESADTPEERWLVLYHKASQGCLT